MVSVLRAGPWSNGLRKGSDDWLNGKVLPASWVERRPVFSGFRLRLLPRARNVVPARVGSFVR